MDLDTRVLRALVAVVEEGTFTDAAIALGTSQAAVSRSVQRLEAALGVRVLTRDSRHVEPTAAGLRVLAQARRVLAAVDGLSAAGQDAPGDLVVGYSWAALGERTAEVQRAWRTRTGGELDLLQTNSASAGLLEGRCPVSVVRRPVSDPRLEAVLVGSERRVAALASDHALATREHLGLADFAGETVAVDVASGTTGADLWPAEAAPVFLRTQGIDEWLTLLASGRAVGISAEATARLHPRPGLTYLPLEDAPEVEVRLVWWRSDPPPGLELLVELARTAYGG